MPGLRRAIAPGKNRRLRAGAGKGSRYIGGGPDLYIFGDGFSGMTKIGGRTPDDGVKIIVQPEDCGQDNLDPRHKSGAKDRR